MPISFDRLCFAEPTPAARRLLWHVLSIGWVAAQVPPPVSFYDFEEASGTEVLDQGTAANHGEIVDPFSDTIVRVATGGIYAEAGEGSRCVEWIEANAFGFLGYVKIPYHAVLNSPNYTLCLLCAAWLSVLS